MAKPPARRVSSDDFTLEVDGTEYQLHEGEWVEVTGGFSVGDLGLMRRFTEIQTRIDATDEDADLEKVILADEGFSEAIDLLQRRIADWNWTDDAGEALPHPHRNPDAFKSLRIAEVLYLGVVVRGESLGEEKNGSGSSPTTSSVTEQPKRRMKSGGGRSR